MAQTDFQTGIYSFRRQEMVASFRFLDDLSFEFFFSYGAVDRYAKGSYLLENETIKLQSDKEAGKDFHILTKSFNPTLEGSQIMIQEKNPVLASNLKVMCLVGEQWHTFFTEDKSEIIIPVSPCERIYLQSLIYPDVVSLIKTPEENFNLFEVSLNLELLPQVSFKGIDLKIEANNTLSCLPNYFMPIENIQFYLE